MTVVRILVLSLAYAAGLLAACAVLVIDTFVLRGLWIPVAFVLLVALLFLKHLGQRIKLRYHVLALSFGVVGFWSLGLPVEILYRYPPLGWLLSTAFTFLALGLLLLGSVRREARWLSIAVLLTFLAAYFSGNTGKPGPMIDWIRSFGLTRDQAEMLTLVIRKCIHFFGYGTIAGAGFMAAHRIGIIGRESAKFGLPFGILVAGFDELRQANSYHRTGSGWDILLDLAGMVLILLVLLRRYAVSRAE